MNSRKFWTSVTSLRLGPGREGEGSKEVRNFHPGPGFFHTPPPPVQRETRDLALGAPASHLVALILQRWRSPKHLPRLLWG